METLRHNLIAARVVLGLSGVEAAKRFGFSSSTQLPLIESGQRKTPNDCEFLRLASIAYGVSTDFLLGLSPHI
jgi:transcriptional regulator with XRE-family HTH domain